MIKPKKKRNKINLFEDNCIPDIQQDFKLLYKNPSGVAIRKSTKPCRHQGDYDKNFIQNTFCEERDGEFLKKNLDIGDSTPKNIKQQLIALIKENWCCFHPEGVKVPIRDYEVIIDTGASKPFACKNQRYGMHESVVMQKAIDSLLFNNQIRVSTKGRWLSRGTLAAKPHQEHIMSIDDFIWRFCVNYMMVNMKTRVIAYPIPRCDDAVKMETGNAKFCILLDACTGYHQLKMENQSALKTAFAGPFGRKYFYKVLPYGLVNGPTTYVIFIYDMREHWNALAKEYNVNIGQDNNTRIILDDTYMFIMIHRDGLSYLKAILEISKRYNITWKLKKCSFFPDRVEFVGHDRRPIGNSPAKSKTPLLKNWPKPTIVRDILRFIGFTLFYHKYMPFYEFCIVNLRKMTSLPLEDKPADDNFPDSAKKEMEDIKTSILSDPILKRTSSTKRIYIRTDFSSLGFGFVALQPGDNKESIEAVEREISGGQCEFELKKKGPRLFPCAFGSKKIAGYQRHVHVRSFVMYHHLLITFFN